MTNEKYNGWANRETWAVALYIGDDEGLSETCRGLDAYHLKANFEDLAADVVDGEASRDLRMMMLDIGSLWRVDWQEVANSVKE